MPDAAWWRAYRQANRERINANARARRQASEWIRRARHQSEARRRFRRRAEAEVDDVPLVHPLLELAAELVPMPARGNRLTFPEELVAEDARSEAILAVLEGRDPVAAVRKLRAAEVAWRALTRPLAE